MLFDSYHLCLHLITHYICTMLGSTFITSVIHSTDFGNTVLFEAVISAGGTITGCMIVIIQRILLSPGFQKMINIMLLISSLLKLLGNAVHYHIIY